VKLNPRLPWQKQHSTGRKFFHQQIGLQFKEEFSEVLYLEHGFFMVLKLGHWESI
jgi:hypothetical protein